MKKQRKTKKTNLSIEITLTFDGRNVKGVWYHPELADVLCSLCGKNCKVKCHNVNPYCG